MGLLLYLPSEKKDMRIMGKGSQTKVVSGSSGTCHQWPPQKCVGRADKGEQRTLGRTAGKNRWEQKWGSPQVPGPQRPRIAVPAECWGRYTDSRWPLRPREFSSLTAGAGLPGSEAPWSALLHSGEGFFLEATLQVGLCCTLAIGKRKWWAWGRPAVLLWPTANPITFSSP